MSCDVHMLNELCAWMGEVCTLQKVSCALEIEVRTLHELSCACPINCVPDE